MTASWMSRYLTPKIVLAVLLALIAGIALLTPNDIGMESSTVLTTHSAAPKSSLALYETARRLGWQVERSETRFAAPLDAGAAYLIMDPPLDLDFDESSAILEAVRNGASLLVVSSRPRALLDSMGVHVEGRRFVQVLGDEGVLATITPGDPSCRLVLVRQPIGLDIGSAAIDLDSTLSFDTTTFAVARSFGPRSALATGFNFGRGRVLVVTAPAMFRNDAMRACERKEGAFAVRMLDWLAPDRDRRLVFAEFHHGHGKHESSGAIIRRAVATHPAGRMLIQICIAALVLLLAVAPRPIPPRPRTVIERRSPFEHVGALARAYEKVGGTRRATKLLVRGLRRRRDVAAIGRASDDEYLAGIAARHPSLESDVARVRAAMQERRTPAEFIEVGEGIANIERKLTSEYS